MPDAVNGEQRDYLGKGWAFPSNELSVQGGIKLSAGAQKVEESIKIILRTQLGERVERPSFGSRLTGLAFEPMNTETLLLIRLYVQEDLERCEPRIIVDQVLTDPDPVRGKVEIIINYSLKDFPDIHSYVYPFYLKHSTKEAE